MDPNYFFRYAKKHSICQSEIAPFLGPTKTLITDKYEICCSLLDQFNTVFTKPNPDRIVTNPFSFFIHNHLWTKIYIIGLYFVFR